MGPRFCRWYVMGIQYISKDSRLRAHVKGRRYGLQIMNYRLPNYATLYRLVFFQVHTGHTCWDHATLQAVQRQPATHKKSKSLTLLCNMLPETRLRIAPKDSHNPDAACCRMKYINCKDP